MQQINVMFEYTKVSGQDTKIFSRKNYFFGKNSSTWSYFETVKSVCDMKNRVIKPIIYNIIANISIQFHTSARYSRFDFAKIT